MEPQKKYARQGTPDCQLSIGYFRKCPSTGLAPHYHGHIELVYVYAGWITCQVDGVQYNVQAGDIFLITPGQVHHYLHNSPDFRSRIITFTTEFLTTWSGHVFQEEFVAPLKAGLLRLPQLIEEDHPAYQQVRLALEWLKYCNSMLMPNYKTMRYTMAVGICSALLPWCTQPRIEHSTVDSDNAIVQKVMSYIRRHYLQPLDLETIANHVHLHPNYLCALFKKHTGQTVMYHLDRTRIDTAVYLLENTQLSISHIAERSGYRNDSAFYYKFKKLTGKTPKQWRQDVLADNAHQSGQ